MTEKAAFDLDRRLLLFYKPQYAWPAQEARPDSMLQPVNGLFFVLNLHLAFL